MNSPRTARSSRYTEAAGSRSLIVLALPLAGILLSQPLFAQDLVVLPEQQYCIDHELHLVVCNVPVGRINQEHLAGINSVHMDAAYAFDEPVEELQTGRAYTIHHPENGREYTLYFSALPLMRIECEYEIVDEPRVEARFHLVELDETQVHSAIGIELHGFSSLAYPKKSYRIEFLEEEGDDETQDVALLDMREDDDWVLNAMWTEPLRMRNKVCHELWRRIHIPAYLEQEPEAQSGVRSEYAELFLNGEYRGLYLVCERVDRKLLKLKKHNGNIRGELYKGYGYGATTFYSLPDFDNDSLLWGGFEWIHPEEEIDWSNLYEAVRFVHTSPEFDEHYAQYFCVENALDYFLYVNVIRGVDNWAKNTYLAKYNQGWPYFYVPWDLDGTFGSWYTGERDPETAGMISNYLFCRLYEDCTDGGYNDLLQERWAELRVSALREDSLLALVDEAADLLDASGVYEREFARWPNSPHGVNDLGYMEDWITERLGVLDTYFYEDCGPVAVEKKQPRADRVQFDFGPNPARSSLSFSTASRQQTHVHLYDLCGRLVYHGVLPEGSGQLEFGRLSTGMYLLQAFQNGSCIGVNKMMVLR